MPIIATTFFATNITLFSLGLTAIVVIVVAIVSIVVLVVLIFAIMPAKSTICKVLNIGRITVIVCHDRGLKLRRKFFKGCYRSKQHKLQFRDSAAYPLSSGNKLVFAHITKP